MNEQEARAIDVGIRAINGATHFVSSEETIPLLNARRILERMLSEGFVQCPECGRPPTPFAMLGEDGWCAVYRCTRNNVYGESLDEVRKNWNEEAGQE